MVLILADTSAWVEFLRATGSAQDLALDAAIARQDLAVCDPVVLELVCSPAREGAVRLESLLSSCRQLGQVPFEDVSMAGEVYRACRRGGMTVRRPNDCLIAAIAIRNDIPVLHRDRDYDAIAQHTPLQVVAA